MDCSCCEDELFEAFNSEDVDPFLGTAHSLEDCLAYSVITERGGVDALSEEELNEVWNKRRPALLREAKRLGIEVEVVRVNCKEVLTKQECVVV